MRAKKIELISKNVVSYLIKNILCICDIINALVTELNNQLTLWCPIIICMLLSLLNEIHGICDAIIYTEINILQPLNTKSYACKIKHFRTDARGQIKTRITTAIS